MAGGALMLAVICGLSPPVQRPRSEPPPPALSPPPPASTVPPAGASPRPGGVQRPRATGSSPSPPSSPSPQDEAPQPIQRPNAGSATAGSATASAPAYASARSQLDSANLAASDDPQLVTAQALERAIEVVEGFPGDLSLDTDGRRLLLIARINRVRAHLNLGDEAGATAALDDAILKTPPAGQLRQAAAEFGPSMAARVEDRLAIHDARPRVGIELRCAAPCSPSIDGFPAALGVHWVRAGVHRVYIQNPDGPPTARTVDASGDPGSVVAVVTLAPPAEPEPPPPPAAAPARHRPTGPPLPPIDRSRPLLPQGLEVGGIVVSGGLIVAGVTVIAATNCTRYPVGCSVGGPTGGAIVAMGLGSLTLWLALLAVDRRRRAGLRGASAARSPLTFDGALRF